MQVGSWVRGPVGIDAGLRVTMTNCRTVLVMAPTVTAGTRVLDLLTQLDADFRVQAVFTVPHHGEIWQGTADFVHATGGLVVPWQQAVQHEWDLVLTASHRHIEQVRGRVLVLPHGAGAMMSRSRSRKAGAATRPTTGLDRELLTYRGRVVPAAVALADDGELAALRRSCPEAAHTGVVAGDLCLDRMVASLPLRDRYRQALGVEPGQRLVTVGSTWSPDSTFGRHPDLYARLLREAAADGTRVAAVLHPNIWAVHGARQVHAWLARARQDGLLVVPPDEGWRAVTVASDAVVGDHGSTTSYAAALGVPTHLATFPRHAVRRGSIADATARCAPLLDHTRPLLPQLREVPGRGHERVADLVSARRGRAAEILRATMYRLLDLPEPSWPARTSPVPLPRAVAWEGS